MALTIGDGPFGPSPAGRFNFTYEASGGALYLEPSPRRVRAVVAGRTVADSTDVKLLHETGVLPTYYFPEGDVDGDLLEPSDRSTTCGLKGQASYYSIVVGGERREDAAWTYPETVEGCPPLDGHIAFYWDAVDAWWEEAERIWVHARDPYHRCDVVDSDRHVVVEIGGQTVADSHRPAMLFETGLPERFYLPEVDVRMDLLAPSDTETACPYKGRTSRYYTVEAGGQRVEDAAWVYDQPLAGMAGIAGKLGFYNERVDLIVDGQRRERPTTRFS